MPYNLCLHFLNAIIASGKSGVVFKNVKISAPKGSLTFTTRFVVIFAITVFVITWIYAKYFRGQKFKIKVF